eukprot:m51a1_g12852 hypothetical protein (391) ;mRNA; f:1284-2912
MSCARLCPALVLLLSVLAQGDVIVVDQQSGPIRTIGAALQLIPVNSQTRTTILVHPGVYSEQVTITPQMGPVTLSGQDPARPDSVLLRSGCAASGDGSPGCRQCPGGEWNSQALFIKSPDFIAMNIAIANDACGYDHKRAGQSLAVQNVADKVAFINVRMYGGQDTFLTGGPRTRVFMLNSFVNGTVDSIFGSGAAVFDHCEIQISSYYTAHRGDPLVKSSYLFLDSKLTKPRGVKTGSTMLGRPWGPNARVIFKNTWMDNHIARAGWADWGHQCETTGWCHNVTYAEYKPSGPGASPDTRPRWTEQLNDTEAAQYTTDTVLRGWNPPRGARSDGDNESDNADNTTTWKDPEGYENDSAMRTPLTDDNTDRGTTYGVTLSLLAVALVLNS